MGFVCLCTTPACFSTLYRFIIVPTLHSWKFLIICILICLMLLNCADSWNSLLVKHVPLSATITFGKSNLAKIILKHFIVNKLEKYKNSLSLFPSILSRHQSLLAYLAILNQHSPNECVAMETQASPKGALELLKFTELILITLLFLCL